MKLLRMRESAESARASVVQTSGTPAEENDILPKKKHGRPHGADILAEDAEDGPGIQEIETQWIGPRLNLVGGSPRAGFPTCCFVAW